MLQRRKFIGSAAAAAALTAPFIGGARAQAVTLHGAQPSHEGVEFLRPDVEQPGQFFEGQRHSALGQRGQHVLAAWQGVFVFPGLALIVRIVLARLAWLV